MAASKGPVLYVTHCWYGPNGLANWSVTCLEEQDWRSQQQGDLGKMHVGTKDEFHCIEHQCRTEKIRCRNGTKPSEKNKPTSLLG